MAAYKLKDYKPTRFMAPDSHYDKAAADYAVAFIESLCHTKGKWAGKPFELIDWQERIVRDIFGVIKPNGYRQFNTAYIEIPKKAGKSELAAAIALLLTCGDGEQRAEVYGCAADRQQAAICYSVASDMVRYCPALAKRVKILDSVKRMVYLPTGGVYQVLSSEVNCVASDTVFQLNDGSLKRADELHGGDIVLAYNGLTPVFDEVVSAVEQKPSPALEVLTHHNRAITVSEEHPFYKMLVGRRRVDLTHVYDWTEAAGLTKGDRVAVALGWPTERRQSEISPLEAWALGAWAGDGDCTHFRFINPDTPVIEKLREFIGTLGCGLRSEYSTRQKETGKEAYQQPIEHILTGLGKRRKSPAREWVRQHYGQESRAKTKTIPDCIWRGNAETWAAFLAGYIDTDGCVTDSAETKIGCSICSVSPEMTKGCQILFARLGINASVVSKYTVRVSGKIQLKRLKETIMSYMVHKKKRQRLMDIPEPYHTRRSQESDKVISIKSLGEQKTIAVELKQYSTHATNGLVTHNSKHGFNTSGVVMDELHAQPNRKLYDVMLRGSGDARMQPLFFIITTAGDNQNSICWEVHCKAKDLLEGRKHDPTFYPVIYGADEGDDWSDPKVWAKANPSLGITFGIDKVQDAFNSAKENPAEENAFRQLRLNQWVKQTIRWMPMDKWDACAFPVDPESLKGRVCYGGLDLSSTTDITAFVLVFPPEDEDDKYIVLPYFWLPADNIPLRVRRDHVMYDVWERQGFINTTEGAVIHYDFVEKFIEDLGKQYNIREIAFDRWGATQMVQDLDGMGFTVVQFAQGFQSMSPPTKELMKLVLEKRIAHGGHPVLRWMMDNIYIKQDPAGNIKPDKEKSTEKIDGAVAMIMALDRAIRCGGDGGGSVYNSRGLLIL